MSGIRELEKQTIRQMEALKRRQDREVKGMETAHQKYKAQIQKAHTEEVVDLREQNYVQLDAENAKKEKVLESMRSHLESTERLTDKQLKALKELSAKETAKTQVQLAEERDRINSQNELYLADINHRFLQQSKKMNQEGEAQVEDMSYEMGQKYSDTRGHFQKKLNDTTNEFTVRFNQEAMNQQKIKNETENQFKKERLMTNQRQQFEMGKMVKQHTDAIESRDVNFRKGLKDQDLFFEKKYATNLTANNGQLKNLEDRHQKVMDRMKTDLSKEITKSIERSDDPFYQFTELRPTMTQYPDRVEIKVAIPEHAKQDLQLTTNIKEAILTFNRRYSDSNKSPEGIQNKVNKVETFTSRLMTDMTLDPKSIQKSFDSGVMTYVIKKA